MTLETLNNENKSLFDIDENLLTVLRVAYANGIPVVLLPPYADKGKLLCVPAVTPPQAQALVRMMEGE